MTEYTPELGQAMFGQPWKSCEASNLLIAALEAIRHELDRVMWNINQREYDSPFGNTGNSFECDEFEVHAYDWNEDNVQDYNFKYGDGTIKVCWYKYFGRGTSVNRELTNDEIASMLDGCLYELSRYEKERLRKNGE